jgi:hypothetical protein
MADIPLVLVTMVVVFRGMAILIAGRRWQDVQSAWGLFSYA